MEWKITCPTQMGSTSDLLEKETDGYMDTLWRGLKTMLIHEKMKEEGLEFDGNGCVCKGQLKYTTYDLYMSHIYEDDKEVFIDKFEHANISEELFGKLVINQVLRREIDTLDNVREFLNRVEYDIVGTGGLEPKSQYKLEFIDLLVG